MMTDALEIWERPEADEIFMLVGWRQWADAGSISSGLPKYLIQQAGARKIASIKPDGFYLFQIPGTHDLVRPVVRFDDGFPAKLETQRNEFYYAGDNARGIVYFIGDEPHMDAERYVQTLLDTARILKVKTIVGFGGVYGELPYDKERMVSSIYSLPTLKEELSSLAVNLSDYHGGASIGSYVCRRASEQNMRYISFYAFVPTYDFSRFEALGKSIRLENDYVAWLGVMRRVNYLLGLELDLADLERKSERLIRVVGDKVEELDREAPQAGIRAYMDQLSNDFQEVSFMPLDDVWEQELGRLFGNRE
jgi:proteasome assembly chaperone (PAC2) family protein